MSLFPTVTFDEISLPEANQCLASWGHKMGELRRGNQGALCYGLKHNGRIVGIATASNLISPVVGGGLSHLTRENTIELSRLCAERPGLCRVVLRLWREFVFAQMSYSYAMSYQDSDIHTGNTYRFDGWSREAFSRSGTDTRSGRKGRNKWIWVWKNEQAHQPSLILTQPDVMP